MEHIKDFTIHRFRGLRDLKLESLGQINLFVGNNNSGKTSALEAFAIFSDPLYWRKWYDIASQRELASKSIIDRLMWVFPWETHSVDGALSERNEILLSASGKFTVESFSASYEKFTEMVPMAEPSLWSEDVVEERERKIEESLKISVAVSAKDVKTPLHQNIVFYNDGPASLKRSASLGVGDLVLRLPSQIVTPLSHRTSRLTSQLWSEVVEADLKSETIKLLRFFDPAIQDVDLISPTESKQLISIKHEKLGRAPLYTFGDGLRRVFMLATTIPRVRGGLLLIDELETAIHTKALEKTFDWLVNACIDNDIQLLATTHSLEALDAVLEASSERADLVVYRLQQDKEQTTATRFDKEMTRRLREELGMELRY